MPVDPIRTYTNQKLEPFQNPELAKTIVVKIPVSTIIAKGTVLGEVTATPGVYGVYAAGGAGGLAVARALMMHDVASDADGNITYGPAATGGEQGETHLSCPVYVSGYFRTTDLVGLDDDAVAELGSLIQGTAADGILKM